MSDACKEGYIYCKGNYCHERSEERNQRRDKREDYMSGERENERDESDSSRYTNDFKSVVGRDCKVS